MTELFRDGQLRDYFHDVLQQAVKGVEALPEDELLARSVDDVVAQFRPAAHFDPLEISSEAIDGDVTETMVDVSGDWGWNGNQARGTRVQAVYPFTGDTRLFRYQPSTHIMMRLEAQIGHGTVTIESVRPGTDLNGAQVARDLVGIIDSIIKQAGHANSDVQQHNSAVDQTLRSAIEGRRVRVQKRRELAGTLGFPLTKRQDAPRPVPLQRKQLAMRAEQPRRRDTSEPYRDEPALTDAQYEEVIEVVRGAMRAMERTPSVASGKYEEELRDQILIPLNGSFAGAATGETFVQRGKTDILVKVDDRHVFVGECKWWTGAKACASAVDQLLSYLPWRNEKAALLLFIDRKDATSVIDKADETIRAHAAFKRVGPTSKDKMARRNYVLGHPDDLNREIQLAALFAVLPKER